MRRIAAISMFVVGHFTGPGSTAAPSSEVATPDAAKAAQPQREHSADPACENAFARYVELLKVVSACRNASECKIHTADQYLRAGLPCPVYVGRGKSTKELDDTRRLLDECGYTPASCFVQDVTCKHGHCVPTKGTVKERSRASSPGAIRGAQRKTPKENR
jgi:hypothetical protein